MESSNIKERKSDLIIVNGITKTEHQRLHAELKKKYGDADKCEMPDCKSINPKHFQWALKRGHTYTSKREDYIKMCTSCHRKYDFNEGIRLKLKAKKYCERNNNAILNNTKVMEIMRYIKDGLSNKEIALLYSVHTTTISNIRTGKKWGTLTGIKWKRTRK